MDINSEQKAWYVVNCYAGHERNVKDNLETRVKNEGLEDKIFQIIIAEEEEIDIKNGKKVSKTRNQFPGYIFVQMIMTDEIWYVVRNTQGVTGFIGSSGGGAKPHTVPKDEMDRILSLIGKNDTKINVSFAAGDRVKVLNGPFANVEGTVESMDDSTGIAKVSVIMFGRETKAEISYVNIQKIDD